jgi:protein-tyrosine sulfotransferase
MQNELCPRLAALKPTGFALQKQKETMRLKEKIAFELLKCKHRLVGKHLLFTVKDEKSSPFFIQASGRSGTTLLRTILLRGDELIIPPESNYLIPELIIQFLKNSSKSWRDLVAILILHLREAQGQEYFGYWKADLARIERVCLELPVESRSLHQVVQTIFLDGCNSNKLWGDKTPILLFAQEYLSFLYPNAKYIFLVRDGRDVIRSRIDHRSDATIDNSIRRWNESCEIIFKAKGMLSPEKYKILRYEDLVSEPEVEVQRVCEFLSVSYSPKMLDHEIRQELGDAGKSHHVNTRKPINTDSIGRWKNYFSHQETEKLNRVLEKNLDAFGYST